MFHRTAISSKTSTGCLCKFSFRELRMHLISNFTRQEDTTFKRIFVVIMESFSIELIEAIARKCSKKGILKILETLTRKYPYRNSTLGDKVQLCQYARRHTKLTCESRTFDVLDLISQQTFIDLQGVFEIFVRCLQDVLGDKKLLQ